MLKDAIDKTRRGTAAAQSAPLAGAAVEPVKAPATAVGDTATDEWITANV